MKLALAQINPTVADLQGNAAKILDFADRARRQGADLAIFPELCVTGYPPLDLLDNPFFVDAAERTIDYVAAHLPEGLAAVVGAPVRNRDRVGKRLYNAALLLDGGRRVAEVHKTLLPTYDVFDEYRYFEPAHERRVVEWRGLRIGLHICEDMWNNQEQAPYHLYRENPVDELAAQGADLFINISASPFSLGKHERRNRLVREIGREHGIPFVLVNTVGANTEIVFDGDSRVHAADGSLLYCAPSFEEHLHVWDMEGSGQRSAVSGQLSAVSRNAEPASFNPEPRTRNPEQSPTESLHDALVLGIGDYFRKTGAFKKLLIGLSGGIDSAVTCALAVAAAGPDKVVGVTMPSRYSSTGSVEDSRLLAEALGIEFHNLSIRPAVSAFSEMLEGVFAGTEEGVAEENLQSRTRGVTLMAISNKFDYLLLSTGNKSEMSVGYATLYGDTNGGLAVLADVFKTQVYELAHYINRKAGREVIPEATITKPPSAELRPGQMDHDTLPQYDILDSVLRLYVENLLEADAIAERTGYDKRLILDILRRVDRNEYKRRQVPPGIRVSGKAFGIGRRLPVVARWNRDSLHTLTPPEPTEAEPTESYLRG